MKKLPVLLKIVALILLGLVLVLGIVRLRLDDAITNTIERSISETLGVYTKIEQLHYEVFNGQLNVVSLTLNNPDGFVTPYFMRANHLKIKTKPLTFLGKNTELQLFFIDDINVNIEQKLTQNNALTILSSAQQQRKVNLQANLVGNQKKFRVERLNVNHVTSYLNFALGIQENPLTIDLPEIEAIELRTLTPENSKGIVLGDLIDRVVSGILKNVLAKSQTAIPQNILDNLQNTPLFSEKLSEFLHE